LLRAALIAIPCTILLLISCRGRLWIGISPRSIRSRSTWASFWPCRRCSRVGRSSDQTSFSPTGRWVFSSRASPIPTCCGSCSCSSRLTRLQSACCWSGSSRRSRPPGGPAQRVREYTCAYAAVSPMDGRLDSLILPEVNHVAMSIFLAELAGRHPTSRSRCFSTEPAGTRPGSCAPPRTFICSPCPLQPRAQPGGAPLGGNPRKMVREPGLR
jgi:hypothetical protein